MFLYLCNTGPKKSSYKSNNTINAYANMCVKYIGVLDT